MARRQLRDSRWLITGASSGIGWALAQELARVGARLLLVARREERLRALAENLAPGGPHLVLAGDITQPGVRVLAVRTAVEAWGALDGLVNNAGVGARCPFVDSDAANLRQLFELNFFSAVELVREALPWLQQGRDPLVVNVGSILARRGVPGYADYCASKFALQGFSEALRAELCHLDIDLLMVNPGTTQSEFFERLLARGGPLAASGKRGVPAAYVARATVRAIARRKHEIVPSWPGRALVWTNRLAPRLLDTLLARAAGRRPNSQE